MKLYSIKVRGNGYSWDWYRLGTDQDFNDWIADGLEVHEVVEIIPWEGVNIERANA